MAQWKPGLFQAKDVAVRRLISAHSDEYQSLLEQARAELSSEPCASCAYLGPEGLELADLLGHDKQGHQVFRILWPNHIRSVGDLLDTTNGKLGLAFLREHGLGPGGLERIHDRVRQIEGMRRETE